MPQQAQVVGPRAPKDDFMKALGLKPSDQADESQYRLMREEAIKVYTELNSDPSNLIDERINEGETQPPYFWHHIKPTVQRQAIVRVWQNAKPGTPARKLFDMGATSGEHGPNWVTVWLLYSVFRSRDVRNNRNRRTENTTSQSSANPPAATSSSAEGTRPGILYDAVRNSIVTRR